MSQKPDSWLPLYIADYRADTARFSTEQHGAYLLIIMDYWRNGPPPDDDAVLAQITGLALKAWRKHRPAIAAKFQISAGVWKHKRIEAELEKARGKQAALSERGKQGAAARWGDDATGSASGSATGMQQAVPERVLADAPSPSPTPYTEVPAPAPSPPPTSETPSAGPPADTARTDAYPPEFEALWSAYPKRMGDNPKRRALHAWRARCKEGIDPSEIAAGVARYAAFVRAHGKEHSEFVKQAATFFGPDRAFLEPWDANGRAADHGATIAEAERRIFGSSQEKDITDEASRL